MAIPTRTITITRRSDGRFVSRNERPMDSPLGVDSNLDMAMGSAYREATIASRDEGCRVVIKVELPNGTFKKVQTIEPPR